MNITVINPNTTESMTKGIYDAACSVAAPETKIIAVTPARGPASIECAQEEICASLGVIEEIHKAQTIGLTDAFIIACYGDPGLDAAREITDRPVIGIAQASMYMAALLAPKFSIITLIPRTIYALEGLVAKYGMERFLASIRATDMSVLDYEADPERGMQALAEASRLAVEKDGAEAICLGCAGMVHFTNRLEKQLGVPVFDGVIAAVKLAEGMVTLGKKTSKICSYDYPPVKEYTGMPEVIKGR